MNVTMKDKLKARLRELLKERPIKARFRREFRRRMMPYGELRAVPVRAIFHHMRNCICKRFLMQTRAQQDGLIRLPSRVETDQDWVCSGQCITVDCFAGSSGYSDPVTV